VLTVAVREHSYYLKYQNCRAEYVKAFFLVINWGLRERTICSEGVEGE